MGLKLVRRLGPLKWLIYRGWYWDAKNKINRIDRVLSRSGRICDIGSGYGTVTDLLRKEGLDLTPIDIDNHAIKKDLEPLCYDGKSIPFPDRTFNQALLLTVLHHTSKPEVVLAEAARVSEQVIVIEDVYSNWLQQYLTYFADSLFNLEFVGHPHSNKTRDGWVSICNALDLDLQLVRSDRFLLFFRQETYLIVHRAVSNT